MKTENLEGTGNIGNESNKNVSRMCSGAISGEISENVASAQKENKCKFEHCPGYWKVWSN
jgi:hypothetical protein